MDYIFTTITLMYTFTQSDTDVSVQSMGQIELFRHGNLLTNWDGGCTRINADLSSTILSRFPGGSSTGSKINSHIGKTSPRDKMCNECEIYLRNMEHQNNAEKT